MPQLDATIDEFVAHINESKTKPTALLYRVAVHKLQRWVHANANGKPAEIPKAPTLVKFMMDIRKTLAPNTCRKTCAGLCVFYRWMMRKGYVRTDHIQEMKRAAGPRRNLSPCQYITEEEYAKITRWLESHNRKYHWMNFLVQVAWQTGMRISDICRLQWSQVDLEAGTITFVPWKTRVQKPDPVVFPMLPEFKSFLIGWRMVHGGWRPATVPCKPWDNAVCKTLCQMDRFNKWSPLKRMRHRIWTECGIDTIKKTHSFRHGFVTRMVNNGAIPSVVGSLTGQSYTVVMKYSHVPLSVKLQALQLGAKGEKH